MSATKYQQRQNIKLHENVSVAYNSKQKPLNKDQKIRNFPVLLIQDESNLLILTADIAPETCILPNTCGNVRVRDYQQLWHDFESYKCAQK